MSNIVPQPQITFENNKIYVDSPVDVKYTLDGLDPVFYGVIYTSPISISHTTTIKAISVNSLGEMSNLVAGTFTPESDVSDGSSGSTWNPSYDDAVTLEELSAMSYVTSYALESASYATTTYVADYVAEHGGGEIPDLSSYITSDELAQELSSYVTKDELSAQSYITSIPSEYITQDELSANSYLTSVPNTYPTYAAIENMSYITMADVSACGYITESDIPSVVVPVVDENLIPKETNTYTLGTSSYLYESAYLSRLNLNEDKVYLYSNGVGQMKFSVNGADRFRINYNTFESSISGETSLGRSDNPFTNSYITNLYTSYIAQNTYVNSYQGLFIGTDRPWYLYGTGGNGNESVQLKPTSAGKYFIIKDVYNNDIVRIYQVNSSGNWIQIPAKINSNIIPTVSASYTLGSADSRWREVRAQTTYTDNIYLGNTSINEKFIQTEGGTLTGRLESNYYTTLNSEGGISSYSSVLVGADDRNSVTMLATRRLCGETSYAAAFFTNSDGRSKFTHKTKTTATTALGSNDDAFLCFNAYGFKLAYSGTPGTAATTEYEVLHMGNIGNLGYATTTELSSYLSLSGGVMSGDIDMNGSKKGIVTSGGGQWKNGFSYAPVRVTSTATANGIQWTPAIGIKDWAGNTWSIGVVNTRELVFSYQAVGYVDSSNTHTEWKINSSGDLTGAGRTFIHSSNYNNYNTTYTYSLAERLNTLFSFDSSTNTLTITTT